jgi:hypothetical protein
VLQGRIDIHVVIAARINVRYVAAIAPAKTWGERKGVNVLESVPNWLVSELVPLIIVPLVFTLTSVVLGWSTRRLEMGLGARGVRVSFSRPVEEVEIDDPTSTERSGDQIIREKINARLHKARSVLKTQRSIENQSRWSSRALVIGQFVLGGILASAFVQQTLSSTLVGTLGLIVLLSQIVRERFNPEGSTETARQYISKIGKLIRKAEDDLTIIDARDYGYALPEDTASPSLHEILATLSQGLSEIEEAA